MTAFLRFYVEHSLHEMELTDKTSITAGGHPSDDILLPIPGLKKGTLRFAKKGGSWEYASSEPLTAGEHSGTLEPEKIYVLQKLRVAFQLYTVELESVQALDLTGQTRLLIGRDTECQIVIGSKQVSGHHACLFKEGSDWTITDLGSVNGTYYNGETVQKSALHPGDVIDIGLCRLIFGETLTVRFSGPLQFHLTQTAQRRVYDESKGYPFAFRRSPRLMEEYDRDAISIEPPPPKSTKPTGGLAGVLIPSLSTAALMLIMTMLLGMSPISLVLTVPTAIIGAGITIHNYRSQGKRYTETERLRTEKYEDYLHKTETELQRRGARQLQVLTRIHPETADCLPIVLEMQRRLWERRPQEEDFLSLRLGKGSIPAGTTIHTAHEHLTLDEDPLASRASQLANLYKTIGGAPVVLELRRHVTAGIVGDREQAIRLARNLILQAAVHHSANELRIVTLCREEEWPLWEFVKWLPHSFDAYRNRRTIARDAVSARGLVSLLEETLQSRLRREVDSAPSPYYLFLCAAPEYLQSRPLLNLLTRNEESLGACTLFLSDRLEFLPKECNLIVDVKAGHGKVFRRDAADQTQTFTIDSVNHELYDTLARALAPVRLDEEGQKELPRSVTFLEGYGVHRPEELDIAAGWNTGRPDKSMAVPIGLRAGGEPFYFDIHESRHGPHGLVAGMTGSGKSEMVQSWILSMALRFSPEQAAFVLVDFKGTGLILPFRRLPHLAGVISDLDVNIERNLTSLESELTRRKELLDAHGVNSISSYLRLYREGKAREPLPYLFLVVDEFAEFKQQFPEFMPVVNRIFAIGRTLGVHVILLTQKPGNVVGDNMNANTRFRWCLKVASAADSRDMLHTPDAAFLTNPGRAYVQVGENEIYEQIQSYWSGAPYDPLRKSGSAGEEKISLVEIDGRHIGADTNLTVTIKASRTELETVVAYLDRFAAEHDFKRPRPIWTPRLPKKLCLASILEKSFDGKHWPSSGDLQPVAGLVDDPSHQQQFPLVFDFVQQGHIAVYGASGSGKTTLLITTVFSAALSLPPSLLSIYGMDFGGGMAVLEALPHCGGIAPGEDAEKIQKLAALITEELAHRRRLFADCGAKNIDTYRELSGHILPRILLVLDNFAPVLPLYPDLDRFFIELSRDGASLGIHWLVSTPNPSALSFRISQNFKWALALHMPDRLDYDSIVGRFGSQNLEDLPGRGLRKGTPPLAFQAALPTEGETETERLQNLREQISRMDAAWHGERPAPIPVMPEKLSLDDIPGSGVKLGLSVDNLSPVTLDPEKTPFLLISQTADADGEMLLTALLLQLMQETQEDALCFAPAGLPGKIPGLRTIRTGEEFDAAIAALMPVMQRRKEAAERGEASSFPPITVAVANLGAYREAVSEQTKTRLHLLAALGRGLGVRLLVLGECDRISRLFAQGDPLITELAQNGTAAALGGTAETHDGIPLRLRSLERQTSLGKHEGYYRGKNGIPVRFQAISRL